MAKNKALQSAPAVQLGVTPWNPRDRGFDSNVPGIFASIMTVSKLDPMLKYRSTYEGVSPADVASIAAGNAFAAVLAQEVAQRNLIVPSPVLIAQQVSSGDDYFRVSDMLADGFPDSQPIHLHLLFSKGDTQPEEDRGALEGLSSLKNNTLIEVADAVRLWFTGHQQDVLNDIAR